MTLTNEDKQKMQEVIDAGLTKEHLEMYKNMMDLKNEMVKVDTKTPEEIRFGMVSAEMKAIFARKNKDYGNSFDKSLDEDGLLVSKIRLGDKYNRFGQLIKHEALVKDESIRDTLIDMANYAIMTVMWLDNNDGGSKLLIGVPNKEEHADD